MTPNDLMRRVEEILDAHHTGLLATVDAQGSPRVRWLTPAVLPGRFGVLYALTASRFSKVTEVRAHPSVEWMLQVPSLGEVVTLRGRMNVVDNPSLRSEALEVIGPRLRAFWKLAHDERDLAVLETVIEEATHYLPMEGRKTVVRFPAGRPRTDPDRPAGRPRTDPDRPAGRPPADPDRPAGRG